MSIEENFIIIGFLYDLRLGSIQIDLKRKRITIRSGNLDLPDLITELYENVRWEDLLVGNWRGDILNNFMEKYPEAFSSYKKLKEKTYEIRKKYRVKIEVKIDRYGHQYSELIYTLKDLNTKTIIRKIEEGLDIFREYIESREEAEHFLYREEAEEKLKHLLRISRNILVKVKAKHYTVKSIMVSNYNKPDITITFNPEKTPIRRLDIDAINRGYEVWLTPTHENIKQRLLKNRQLY